MNEREWVASQVDTLSENLPANYGSARPARAFTPLICVEPQRILQMDEILLSSSVTIAKYRQFEEDQDRMGIANFVQERFTERYITPLQGDSSQKHGFCTMAICCLMIEELESFWRGWPDTERRSELAFCSFLDRHPGFSVFHGYVQDFYRNVQCGILHQAETTNGWRIRREGSLFDPSTKTINASKLHDELERCLHCYCQGLKQQDWDSQIWQNLRKKMKAVIEHCVSAA